MRPNMLVLAYCSLDANSNNVLLRPACRAAQPSARYSFRSLASTGFPGGYSKSVCVRLHSENSEPTIWFFKRRLTTPPGATALPMVSSHNVTTLAKFQLVWRRLCDVLILTFLVEDTVTPVCALPH